MTNIETLRKKISEIEKYFQKTLKYRQYSPKELKDDDEHYRTAERYLYLLCQATIDFAEAVISHYSYRLPGNYGEIFLILQENDLINRDLAGKMIKMAGFRNILAHAYGEVKFEEFYLILIKDSDDIKKFVEEIKQKIKVE